MCNIVELYNGTHNMKDRIYVYSGVLNGCQETGERIDIIKPCEML